MQVMMILRGPTVDTHVLNQVDSSTNLLFLDSVCPTSPSPTTLSLVLQFYPIFLVLQLYSFPSPPVPLTSQAPQSCHIFSVLQPCLFSNPNLFSVMIIQIFSSSSNHSTLSQSYTSSLSHPPTLPFLPNPPTTFTLASSPSLSHPDGTFYALLQPHIFSVLQPSISPQTFSSTCLLLPPRPIFFSVFQSHPVFSVIQTSTRPLPSLLYGIMYQFAQTDYYETPQTK